MKTKARLLLLLTVTLLLSHCDDDDDKSKDCDKTTFVKTVVNTSGTVRFSTTMDAYVIITIIQGTVDSQDIGVVCNLQKDLQQEELEVAFDGNYFHYSGPVPEVAGQEYYYLELDKITPK